MKRLGIAATMLLVLGTAAAQAQTADPQCNKLGTAITGGNTTLGQGGTLGGLPHWTVGVRANLVHDADLAALAIEHGLILCSTDGDFARFPGLRWDNPLAA